MLNNFLQFLGLSDNKTITKNPKIINYKYEDEEISIEEKKIYMDNPIHFEEKNEDIDYEKNEIIKTTKTITPINEKMAIVKTKKERIPK